MKPKKKREYLEKKHAEHEVIHLDADWIERNSEFWKIAKLILDIFYGMFGQRVKMKKCMFVTYNHAMYSIPTH